MTKDEVGVIAKNAIGEYQLPWTFMQAGNVQQNEWRVTFSNQEGELKIAYFVGASDTEASIRKGILAAFEIFVA